MLPPNENLLVLNAEGLRMYGPPCFMERPDRRSLHSITRKGHTTIVRNVKDPHILSTVVATTEPWRFHVLLKLPKKSRTTE